MTGNTDIREKGQALFLAAIMVLSVVAMSAAFVGGAAAQPEAGDVDVEITAPDDGAVVGTNIDLDVEATVTNNDDVEDIPDDYEIYWELYDGDVDLDEATVDDIEAEAQADFDGIDAGEDDSFVFEGIDLSVLDNGDYVHVVAIYDDEGNLEYESDALDITLVDEVGDAEREGSNIEDVSTVFQGQSVWADVDDDDVELRQGDEDDSSFVTQLNVHVDDQGQQFVQIDTDDLDGEYILRVDGEDDTDLTFEVAVQTLDANWNVSTVEEGEEAELEIDSNRAGYTANITSDDFDSAELEDLFGAEDNASATDGVYQIDGDSTLVANFTGVDAGNYTFDASVIDTTAEANATIEVGEAPDAQAEFTESSYTAYQGGIAEFEVDLEGSEDAWVQVGTDDLGYNATVHVHDGSESGNVTVYMNTYLAGQEDVDENDVYWTEDDDDEVVSATLNHPDEHLERPLDAADYDMSVTAIEGGEEQDLAALVIYEYESGDELKNHIAPSGEDIDDASDVREWATAADVVAENDQVIASFEASSLEGVFDGEDDLEELIDAGVLSVTVEENESSVGPNQNPANISVDNIEIVNDFENDTHYLVIDISGAESGEVYDVLVEFEDDGALEHYLDDDVELESQFEIVDRQATLDDTMDANLNVTASEDVSMSGETTLAPGSEIELRLRSTAGTSFIHTQDVTVDDDYTWNATVDLSEKELGTEFDIMLRSGGENIAAYDYTGMIVDAKYADGPAGVCELTVNVEDEDGNAISGATVSVGDKSEATGSDGSVVMELNRGDHTLDVSADGYEDHSQMVTLDSAEKSVTVTLSEETEDEYGDDDPAVSDDDADDVPGADDDFDGDDDVSTPSEDQPGFGVIVALIALLAAAGLAARNRV
ncbi:DUF7827 domain-containing protein [Natronorarus salvus]|uniref:DUF7827 domain-containing protein n=1 Tax=Natronorarus salvus TaxID=3117733 RepID=UPI002F26A608